MKLKATFLALGIFGLAMTGNGAAFAGELYPGAGCAPETPSNTNYSRNHGYLDIHTKSLNFTCPIVRKDTTSTKPITVYVRGSNSGSRIGCQVVASDWKGSTRREGTKYYVPGTFGYGAMTVYGPTNFSGGMVVLECSGPSGSSFKNYYVIE